MVYDESAARAVDAIRKGLLATNDRLLIVDKALECVMQHNNAKKSGSRIAMVVGLFCGRKLCLDLESDDGETSLSVNEVWFISLFDAKASIVRTYREMFCQSIERLQSTPTSSRFIVE